MSARRLWREVHLWLALILGLFAALLGLTGTALTLATPLARWEQGAAVLPPYERATERPVRAEDVPRWIAAIRDRWPDIEAIEAVAGPGAAPFRTAVPLLVAHGPERMGEETHLIIAVDPASGAPLGRFVLEETVTGTLLALHARLLLPLKGGLEAAAVVGFAILLSTVTGLWLWWPKRGAWRGALAWPRGARGRRAWVTAHNLSGVYAALAMLLLAVSGIWLAKPGWMDPAVSLVSPVRKPLPVAPPGGCEGRAEPQAIVAAALAHWPGAFLGLVAFPEEAGKPALARLRREGDPNQRFGSSVVIIDPACARVIAVQDSTARTAGEWLKSWMHPLHTDLGLGVPGQVLVAAAGFVLPGLYVSGIVLWLRRRRTDRQRAAARQDASVPAGP